LTTSIALSANVARPTEMRAVTSTWPQRTSATAMPEKVRYSEQRAAREDRLQDFTDRDDYERQRREAQGGLRSKQIVTEEAAWGARNGRDNIERTMRDIESERRMRELASDREDARTGRNEVAEIERKKREVDEEEAIAQLKLRVEALNAESA
jgi:hypothetical protein